MALTLGIIGAGHMGTLHAQNLMADERVQLVGVADVDQGRAETLARLVKGKTLASVEALLDTGVQAVYVCTPNTLHTAATTPSSSPRRWRWSRTRQAWGKPASSTTSGN